MIISIFDYIQMSDYKYLRNKATVSIIGTRRGDGTPCILHNETLLYPPCDVPDVFVPFVHSSHHTAPYTRCTIRILPLRGCTASFLFTHNNLMLVSLAFPTRNGFRCQLGGASRDYNPRRKHNWITYRSYSRVNTPDFLQLVSISRNENAYHAIL